MTLGMIAIAASALYALLLAWYLIHWMRIPPIPAEHANLPYISVVIAARNEEQGIGRCIASFRSMDYPQDLFEVIIVDDHSSDRTADIIHDMAVKNVRVIQPAGQGKKAALATGIQTSRGEIVATTDADCLVPPQWLNIIGSAFDEQTHAVTGPVCYTETKGLLQNFQALEVLGLMLITGGGVQSGMHYLANGANLAFRRSAFDQVGGYAGNEHYASGDDLFLVEKIAHKYPGGFRYLKSVDAIVHTFPELTVPALLSQRLRWASKNHALATRSVDSVWSFVWLVTAILLLGIFTLPFQSGFATQLIVGALLIKLIADAVFLYTGGAFAKKQLMRWFIPAFIINLPYVLYIGLRSRVRREYDWKGRASR